MKKKSKPLFCDAKNFLACEGMIAESMVGATWPWPGLQDDVSFRAMRLWCRERGVDINYLEDHLIVVKKVPPADLPFMPLDRVAEQLATAPATAAPTKAAIIEEPTAPANPNDERDRYIYEARFVCKPRQKWATIKNHVEHQKGWGKLGSIPAVRNAAQRYAERYGLPLPKSKRK